MNKVSGKFVHGLAILASILLPLISGPAHADRIKDLASVQGVRNNQLVGYGLVVGLDGTGDQTTQTPFTTQSIINMLAQLGTTLPTTLPSAVIVYLVILAYVLLLYFSCLLLISP